MKEQLISFDTAKLAKEKGFDILVFYHYTENPVNELVLLVEPDGPQMGQGWVLNNYNNGYIYPKYSAPTQSLLQKWLREKHSIIILIDSCGDNKSCSWSLYYNKGEDFINSKEKDWEDSYEEALEKGLQEALKLIK